MLNERVHNSPAYSAPYRSTSHLPTMEFLISKMNGILERALNRLNDSVNLVLFVPQLSSIMNAPIAILQNILI